ncbi:hypothetical protein HDU93_004347 [Gonapodya sp. JEL0774]|nr:hypothetical protein HDU93_004347 [Gonapodya sp. JEL0774]
MDTTLALQQLIQSRVRADPTDVEAILTPPETIEEATWQYEQLRQICMELNSLVTLLEQECTYETCPEMKADEWQYLCAAHPSPQSCCAIDYIVHTLDGATALLNSHRHFPSRVSIPEPSIKQFQNIARRLYRVFAHAWFSHREIFLECESEHHLYARFLRFSTSQYKLVPEQLSIIPADALENPR